MATNYIKVYYTENGQRKMKEFSSSFKSGIELRKEVKEWERSKGGKVKISSLSPGQRC